MRIFLVAGKAHSGKATIANIIKEYYKEEKTIITEYSKYIKLYAKEMLDWDGAYETKPRGFLQKLGYDVRTNMDKYFFINRMLDDIKIYIKYTDVKNIIIADCRYAEEIESIKEKFDNVTSIYTINEFGTNLLTDDEKRHISETSLENYEHFDYVIHNNDINKLKEEVIKILEER